MDILTLLVPIFVIVIILYMCIRINILTDENKFLKRRSEEIKTQAKHNNNTLTRVCKELHDLEQKHKKATSNQEDCYDINVESVRQKLLDRSNVGIKKYNTTTNRDDLNDKQWLIHLQEELMDASVYVQTILNRSNNG